ncbi:tail fiber domain-containing protein [Cedecea lapagei]|uniref:tail fiber domain-containing protein n=1 Tax=Cedecea lapagei TaxID=158823 RepID=UPI001BCF49B6|nr:tail fiber domain-containing protein [Cedecea lapagei]
MAQDIFSGNGFKLYYETDVGNELPTTRNKVMINEVNQLPELQINNDVQDYETYDSEYTTKLLGESNVGDMTISVNYIATDPTHQFLDEKAETAEPFQIIMEYANTDEGHGGIQNYAILNGFLTSGLVQGDKDTVLSKQYNFAVETVVSRATNGVIQDSLRIGDFGVGSNGVEVPQYAPVITEGNAFTMLPAGRGDNPVNADMLGISLIDQGKQCGLQITKEGAIGVYVSNANNTWTRIYTMNQTDARYVPLTRTINGYTLEGNIVLNPIDVKSVPNTSTVNGKLLTSNPVLTPADIGSVPATRTVNGKALSSNITLTPADVKAVQDTATINGKVVKDNPVLTSDDTGSVPNTATVNGVLLTSNPVLDAAKVKAVPDSATINGYAVKDSPVLTSADTGSVPTTRTINGKPLSDNITISVGDVSGVPSTRTVNGKALSSNIVLDAVDVKAVPDTATINGKAVKDNPVLTSTDVKAVQDTATINGKSVKNNPVLNSADVSAVPLTRKINDKALTTDVTLTAADVKALPDTTTINGKVVGTDFTLNASEVSAVADTATINGKLVTSNPVLTSADTGSVPSTRTVNGIPLSNDISLGASDVNAASITTTVNGQPLSNNVNITLASLDGVPTSRKINGKALTGDITLTLEDIAGGELSTVLYKDKNLSDVPNKATARTNLGLGSMAVQNNGEVNITGGNAVLSYLTSTSATFGSTATAPLSIASPSPTIKLTEAGIKDWVLVAHGGTIRLQPDSSGSPDIAFSFNPANKLMSLMNVNASSLSLGTALGIGSGGTGANSYASARTNLGVNLLEQNSSDTSVFSPNRQHVLVQYDVGQWGSYNINAGRWNALGVAQGGTGASDATAARTNLGLGISNVPVFTGIELDTTGVSTTGIVSLNALNSTGAIQTQTRLFGETQNGVGQSVLHTASNGKNAYLIFDENGKLTVPRLLVNGDVSSVGSIVANQGQIVGLGTQNGGNKNLYMSNTTGDGSTGGWVNRIHGDWYNGYWNLGAVRGGGTDIESVTLEVNSQGTASNAFSFYPSYGGHMQSPKGYTVNSGTAGAWGLENTYMASAYYIPTVVGNVGGWTPFLSGGSTAAGGGYNTRIAFGALGNTAWSQAVIKLLGDGTFHRAYQFDVNGTLYSWASPEFGSNYVFTSNATSDKNLKHDIQYTDGKESYDRVMKWLPTMFKYNGQDTQRYGLIAQDLQAIDPQYVKVVPGSPIFEEVKEYNEKTDEFETVSKETGKRNPDTLSLDNNVLLTDLACTVNYMGKQQEKQQAEIDELKKLVQQLMNK